MTTWKHLCSQKEIASSLCRFLADCSALSRHDDCVILYIGKTVFLCACAGKQVTVSSAQDGLTNSASWS